MRARYIAIALVTGLPGTLGCGNSDGDEHDDAVEAAVIVTSERVEVHVHHPGSCREATAIPEASACEDFGWALVGVDSSSVTELCTPEPTCVTEIRLESDGEVVASSPGPSVGFYTSVVGHEARVVLSGCGDPIVIELPVPLADDVTFESEASSSTIHVSASGPSVVSVFARAEGLVPYARGYVSSCLSESGPVELPTSSDFDAYSVTAFALGAPAASPAEGIQVYPAQVQDFLVSKSASLGSVWDAAVLVASQSSLYSGCSSYCSAWNEQCGQQGDPTECAVSCVVAGELAPDCSDSWKELIACMEASLSCNDLLVVNYSEDPSARSQQGTESSCAAEQEQYTSCVEAE